jgi:hypothetical protein
MFLLQVHINQACNPCIKKKTTDTITYRPNNDVIPREHTTTQMTNQFQHTNQIETTNPMQTISITIKNTEPISDRKIDKITPLESITTPSEIMKPIFLTLTGLTPHLYGMILHFLDVDDISTYFFVQMILHSKPHFFATMPIQNQYDSMFVEYIFKKKYKNHLIYGKNSLKFWGKFNSTVSFTFHVAENFSKFDTEEFFFTFRWVISKKVLQKHYIKYSSYELIYDYQNEILTFPKTFPFLKGQVLNIKYMKKHFFPFVIIFTFYDQIPQVNFISNLQMIYLHDTHTVYFICKVHQYNVQILLDKDQTISVRVYTEDNFYRRLYNYSFTQTRSQSQPEFKRYKFIELSTTLKKFCSERKYYDFVSHSLYNFDQYINDNSILHIKNIYINDLHPNNN